MKTILFILLLVPGLVQAQYAQKEGPGAPKNKLGGYALVASETFYTKNLIISAGLRWRETRIGYYQQQAQIPSENVRLVRKGFFVEQGLFNVDKFAYLSAGVRVLTTDKQFVTVVPHFTVAFRFLKYVEVPITFSGYKGSTTGAIGVRLLF